MITLPNTLIATKYPGYFWCYKTEKLFSIKIGGILSPLKLLKPVPVRFTHSHSRVNHEYHYNVSVKGQRKYLFVKDLNKLKIEPSMIKFKEGN